MLRLNICKRQQVYDRHFYLTYKQSDKEDRETVSFTRIRFFMLDAHSRFSKLMSSAFSSKTSSPLYETLLTQDIVNLWSTQFGNLFYDIRVIRTICR